MNSNKTNLAVSKFHNHDFYFTILSKKNCDKKGIEYKKPLEYAIKKCNNLISLRRGYLSANGREYNQYGNLPYDVLNKIWKKNNGLYEILKEKRKLYFDIEYPTDNVLEKEQKTNKLIADCIKEICEKLKIPYESSNFAISKVVGKFSDGVFKGVNKYSAHIICNNDYAFQSVEDIKIFKDYLSTLLEEEKYKDLWFGTMCAIDTAVYGSNQTFKLPYQAKTSNKFSQTPMIEKCELKDFLISYDSEKLKPINVDSIKVEKTKHIENIKKKYKLSHVPRNNQSIIIIYSKYLEKIQKEKYFKNVLPEELNVETLLNNIYNGEGMPYQVYMAVGTALKRCINDKERAFNLWNDWTKKCESNYDESYNKKQFAGYSEQSCGYNTLMYLASLCNPKIAEYNTNPINFILNDDLHKQYTTIEKVNKRYIEITKQIADQYKYMFIRSPMGTGKSYMLHKMLDFQEYDEELEMDVTQFSRCIYLSSRQAFACSMASDFKEDGFVNYMDYGNFKGHERRIICSIESLHKIQHDECDLLIIDESESIFNIVSSETLLNNGLEENLTKLKSLIINSKKVLIMDAFLSNRSFKAIIDVNANDHKVKKENAYYLKNDYKYEPRTAKEHEKKTMVKEIVKMLEENKRVVVCTGSKKYGDTIVLNVKKHFKDWTEDEEILFYNKHNQLPNETNVNDEWSKCKILIYSPTITCGISYTNKEAKFDNLFIYCVNKGSSHFRDTIQAHKRIRNFTNSQIGICINDAYNGFSVEQNPINFNIIKEYLRDYRFELFKKEDYETTTLEENKELKEWIFEIHTFNIMEKNIHSLHLREVVEAYFEIENIKLHEDINVELLEIAEVGADDWKSEDIALINANTFNEYTKDIQMKKYDIEKIKEMRKYKFHEKFDTEKMDKFHEVFNEWFMEDRRKYINNISAFKVALKTNLQEYINKNNPTKYVEYFKQNLLAYQHSIFILDKLGLLTEDKKDVDFKKEFNTLQFEPIIETYKNMDALTINQLFSEEYVVMKNKKGEKKEITTRSIQSILNKLLKEYFNYEIISKGSKQKRINGKKKNITNYKIMPNQKPDEEKGLKPIKHNLFEYIKIEELAKVGIDDMFEDEEEEEVFYFQGEVQPI